MKLFLIFISFTFLSITCFAQKSTWEYGFHGAANYNAMRGDVVTGSNKDALFGVGFGFDLRYKSSKHFSLLAMPGVDQNGWALRSLMFESIPPGANFWEMDVLTRLLYLNLPILANYHFGEKVQYHAGAGVFGGYLLESLLITKPSNKNAGYGKTGGTGEDYKVFNYGLSFTAGAQFPLSKRFKLNLSLLDNLGLANINKTTGIIRTNSFSAIAGVTFVPK